MKEYIIVISMFTVLSSTAYCRVIQQVLLCLSAVVVVISGAALFYIARSSKHLAHRRSPPRNLCQNGNGMKNLETKTG